MGPALNCHREWNEGHLLFPDCVIFQGQLKFPNSTLQTKPVCWVDAGMHALLLANPAAGSHPMKLVHAFIIISKWFRSQVWWHMHVIPELQEWKQEDCHSREKACLKNKQQSMALT